MATLSKKRSVNLPGNFYVDSSCIDCETCRILAPDTFGEDVGGSYVKKQPKTDSEMFRALQALVACPTTSIGTEDRLDLSEAKSSFPRRISENVYHCGFHSRSSFGAFSYLILREKGNVLVDSPRFIPSLAEKIKEMGGIKFHFLTHRDDVADHRKFHEEFGTQRIIHEGDSSSVPGAEIRITGDAPFEVDKDLVVIPVPGHTKGHAVLLYEDRYLFTGDHLAYDPSRDRMIAFRNACWYSWKVQIESMRELEKFDFQYILPGHGYPSPELSSEQKKEKLKACIEWMVGR